MNQLNKSITTNLRTLLSGAVIIIACVVGLIFLYDLNRPDKLVQYQKEFKAYQDTVVVPVLRRNDSLVVIADAALDSANKVKVITDSLRRESNKTRQASNIINRKNQFLLDSLKKQLLPPECDLCLRVVDGLKVEIDTLKSTIVILHTTDSLSTVAKNQAIFAAGVLAMQVDTLRKVIVNIPIPPKRESFFGLHLSKKVIFYTGVVGGAAAAVVIQNTRAK
jgi:hypothetical protein